MGVPGFFLWLSKKYKKENFVFKKNNIVSDIDYLLFDANSLIHPICFKIVAENPNIDNDRLENKMFNAVIEYIDKLIDFVNPTKSIYIAIDGVAPVAKIKQQRMRRFKSVADRNLYDKIKKKHNKEVETFWNNSAITPGTDFMDKLDEKILKWVKEHKRDIIYSSWREIGEGEHKLLHYIKNKKDNNKYVIYGLDADLIFLSLSTNLDNIYLLREANQINNNGSKDELNYVSIDIMKRSIISTLSEYIELQGFKLEEDRLINDFIFLCYFLGNDFLPHIPSLDIHKNGIEYLILYYTQTINEFIIARNKIKYLLKKIKSSSATKILNKKFLFTFINKLANKEEETLKENFIKGKRRLRTEGDEYEQEIFRIENLQFRINDPIQLGSDSVEEWRIRYYKHYYGVENDIENFVERLVENYLIGIKWVTLYYFEDCPAWEWYFPYDHPPFISDISKYFNNFKFNKYKFKKGKPLEPIEQLLSVLPPQSNYLLPEKYRKFMTNTNSSLAYLYPLEFEQDFINKNKYWMAIPNLPPLDIELVRHIYNKYKD